MGWLCVGVSGLVLLAVVGRFLHGVVVGFGEYDPATAPVTEVRPRIVNFSPDPPKRAGWVEDATFGDALARRLRSELAGGDWQGSQAALEGTRGAWDEREFLVDALGEHAAFAGRERVLDAWLAARPQASGTPEAALPLLVRGRWQIAAAWKARGGGSASTVTEEGWKRFFAHLNQAQRDFEAAAGLDPEDPTPWALQVITGRGLQRDKAEVRRVADEALKRDRLCWSANRMLLVALCQKWSGTHEAMFEHARACTKAAPDGHILHALIAQAHIERWLWAASFAAEKKDDPQWYGNSAKYFLDPAVKDEVLAAYARSLGSPRWRESKLAPHARNDFAWCLLQMGDTARARVELEKLGSRLTQTPWGFQGETRTQVEAARKQVGLGPLT